MLAVAAGRSELQPSPQMPWRHLVSKYLAKSPKTPRSFLLPRQALTKGGVAYIWIGADGKELDKHTEKGDELEPRRAFQVSLGSRCMAQAALVFSGISSRCIKICLLKEETPVL